MNYKQINIDSILIFFLLAVFTNQVFSQTQGKTVKPESVGFSSERLARVDTFLTNQVKAGHIPNAVTYVYRNGKLLHHKAYGWKNIEKKEPVQLNSIFRNASQTKALTSVGLMMLYEKGLFLLDDPISKYIQEFKNPTVLDKINDADSSFTCHPAKREITIRDLLSHTSGIPYGNKIYAKAQIPEVNSLKQITTEDVIRKIARLPLIHEPGEGWTYGLNTDVLGYLIEVLSGKSLDIYFQKELLEPLEMKDSYFYLPGDKADRLVTLYAQDKEDGPLYISPNVDNQNYPIAGAKTYFSGGAGLCGPIGDYANFCLMLLNKGNYKGKQIISPKTVELMTRNQIGDFEVWDRKEKFGLGFELVTEKSAAVNLSSVGAFGWGGMYATDYVIDPKEDMILLVYTNCNPLGNQIGGKFKVLVYQALHTNNEK